MSIRKALVVDDSKVAHLTLRKMLTERGIAVDWVDSGEAGIEYLRTQAPDVVFMDVMMPGLDGFETSGRIVKDDSLNAPPIVMCSANASEDDQAQAKRSGAIGFLSKPYTPEELGSVLETVAEVAIRPANAKPRHAPPPVEPAAVPVGANGEAAPYRPSPAPAPAAVDRDLIESMVREAVERTVRESVERAVRETVERSVKEIAERVIPGMVDTAAVTAASHVAKETVLNAEAATKEMAASAAERSARQVAEETIKTQLDRLAHSIVGAAADDALERGLEARLPKVQAQAVAAAQSALAERTKTLQTDQDTLRKSILRDVARGMQEMSPQFDEAQISELVDASVGTRLGGVQTRLDRQMAEMRDALVLAADKTAKESADLMVEERIGLMLPDARIKHLEQKATAALVLGAVASLLALGLGLLF